MYNLFSITNLTMSATSCVDIFLHFLKVVSLVSVTPGHIKCDLHFVVLRLTISQCACFNCLFKITYPWYPVPPGS